MKIFCMKMMKVQKQNFLFSDVHDKYLLYMEFVAWYCKGCSVVPLSDYANNLTFQELPDLNNYFTNSDEKLFIDLRRGKGYTGELEKLNTDGGDLTIAVTLKAVKAKKRDYR